MILIVTVREDLHALVVQRQIRAAHSIACHIIECDHIAQRDAISYEITPQTADAVLTSEGISVAASQATVVWLRTTSAKQVLSSDVADEHARSVINNDCRAALTGLLAARFRGKWVSSPEATYSASDKILQLRAAWEAGFRIPRTLVTQSRDDVIRLFDECENGIIVKTLAGAPGPLLETVKINDPRSFEEDVFQTAPAIFQEYIPGSQHIRLNCFGDNSFAATIESQDVDWRRNIDVPIASYAVSESLHGQVRRVLDDLGLAMGIVDLKLSLDGEHVWLEVNPQGQFLFLDALTDLCIGERFAKYLVHESKQREACADADVGAV